MNELQVYRRRRSTEEIAQIVEGFEKSGLSKRAYALQIGESPANVGRWVTSQRADSETSEGFVPVRVSESVASAEAIEVALPSGANVKLPVQSSGRRIEEILSAIERALR